MADLIPDFIDAQSTERFWCDGQCHCGAVRFRAALARHIVITECNCSICHAVGHQEIMVPDALFELLAGAEVLQSYRFNTQTAEHMFCIKCGVKPFFRPRSHPSGFRSINARCVTLREGMSSEYTCFDGQNWEASIATGAHQITS
jgi:hypothetical protein